MFKPQVKPELNDIPKHIAIIMDGNGRWAEQRGLPRTAGHKAGLQSLRDAITVCILYGVPYLTVYAFSTENWSRPSKEVDFLMNLFEDVLKNETERLHQQGVKLNFIGLRHNLKPSLVQMMESCEAKTSANDKLTLNIAINYGGRSELLEVTRKVAAQVKAGTLEPEKITENEIIEHLFTKGQPDPDLLIRTSGESRISNFLIWQIAYAELYFADKLWPDFGKDDLAEAIEFYSKRERRFGGLKL